MFNSSETITFKMLKVSNDQDYVFFFLIKQWNSGLDQVTDKAIKKKTSDVSFHKHYYSGSDQNYSGERSGQK